MKKQFGSLMLASVLCGIAQAEDVTKTFKADTIKSLKITNGVGDVAVEGKTVADATITVNRVKWAEGCDLVVEQEGDTLKIVVEQKKSKWFGSDECHANVHAIVPASVATTVTTGSGNIRIVEMTGDIETTMGSGDLTMERVDAKQLKLTSGSGDMKLDLNMLTNADMKVGSGDIAITSRKLAPAGATAIKAGSGDTIFRLPADAVFNIDFKAGSGDVDNAFTHAKDAAYMITARSGSGDLSLKKL